jgi:transposase
MRKFRRKFRGERVPSRQTIHNLVNKLRSTGLLIDKKQKHKRRVLTEEKLDDMGARLEHTPRKSLKRPAQETGVSKSSARRATQFLQRVNQNLFRRCEECVRVEGQHFQHLLCSVKC